MYAINFALLKNNSLEKYLLWPKVIIHHILLHVSKEEGKPAAAVAVNIVRVNSNNSIDGRPSDIPEDEPTRLNPNPNPEIDKKVCQFCKIKKRMHERLHMCGKCRSIFCGKCGVSTHSGIFACSVAGPCRCIKCAQKPKDFTEGRPPLPPPRVVIEKGGVLDKHGIVSRATQAFLGVLPLSRRKSKSSSALLEQNGPVELNT